MGMGFAPSWLRQVSPPLHMTTLTTGCVPILPYNQWLKWFRETGGGSPDEARVTRGHWNRYGSTS